MLRNSGANHARGRAFGSVAGEHGQNARVLPSLRDEFAPGKPMWLTETAEAACGGNPWASTFLDTFRYLDQLGRLAKAGVQMVAHNTLAASDYGLLDETTLRPRPNYWAALLWRRLMGTIVLDAGVHDGVHVYAHCRRGARSAVTLLAINTDRTNAVTLRLPVSSERYTLSADDLQSAEVTLNGTALELGPMTIFRGLTAAVTSPPVRSRSDRPRSLSLTSRTPEIRHAIEIFRIPAAPLAKGSGARHGGAAGTRGDGPGKAPPLRDRPRPGFCRYA